MKQAQAYQNFPHAVHPVDFEGWYFNGKTPPAGSCLALHANGYDVPSLGWWHGMPRAQAIAGRLEGYSDEGTGV
jgi:hypothetical protein